MKKHDEFPPVLRRHTVVIDARRKMLIRWKWRVAFTNLSGCEDHGEINVEQKWREIHSEVCTVKRHSIHESSTSGCRKVVSYKMLKIY